MLEYKLKIAYEDAEGNLQEFFIEAKTLESFLEELGRFERNDVLACPACAGDGYTQKEDEEPKKCEHCGGTAFVNLHALEEYLNK